MATTPSEFQVYTRMGSPVVIVGAEITTTLLRGESVPQLWVTVRFADGKEHEVGVWDLNAEGGIEQIMQIIYAVNPAIEHQGAGR